jgi:DNA-binding GntR family transcriptional regulator
VIKLDHADLIHIYEVRGALEGMAARIIVEKK